MSKKRPKGILKLDPRKELPLHARLAPEGGALLFRGELRISNPSETQALAYKVKTTVPERYYVSPNQGIIGSMAVAKVKVVVAGPQAAEVAGIIREDPDARAGEMYASEDRFLVQSLVLSADDLATIDSGDPKEHGPRLTALWDTKEKKTFFNEKLKVKYPPVRELPAQPAQGAGARASVPPTVATVPEDDPPAEASGVDSTLAESARGAAPAAAARDADTGTDSAAKPTSGEGAAAGAQRSSGVSASSDGWPGRVDARTASAGSAGGGGGSAGAVAGASGGGADHATAARGAPEGAQETSPGGQQKKYFKEMADLRQRYNDLMTYTINLDGDLKRAQNAYQAKLVELETARKRNAQLTEELEAAASKDGLRNRLRGGDKAAPDAADAARTKDGAAAGAAGSGGGDGEAFGFALWHIVLVGLVMFLVGRLIS